MNLNKAILIGRLTRDPESRTTPSGQTVTSFGLATNRIWNDQSGQKQEMAEFHNIVAWQRLAEICQQYLKKGSLAMIEGRIQTRSYQTQEGITKYRTEIIADNIQLGPRSASQGGGYFQPANPTQTGQSQDSPNMNQTKSTPPLVEQPGNPSIPTVNLDKQGNPIEEDSMIESVEPPTAIMPF